MLLRHEGAPEQLRQIGLDPLSANKGLKAAVFVQSDDAHIGVHGHHINAPRLVHRHRLGVIFEIFRQNVGAGRVDGGHVGVVLIEHHQAAVIGIRHIEPAARGGKHPLRFVEGVRLPVLAGKPVQDLNSMQGLGIEDDDPVILLVRHHKIAATVPDNVGGGVERAGLAESGHLFIRRIGAGRNLHVPFVGIGIRFIRGFGQDGKRPRRQRQQQRCRRDFFRQLQTVTPLNLSCRKWPWFPRYCSAKSQR